VLRTTGAMLESTLRQNIVSAQLLLRHAGAAMVRAGGGAFVAVSSMQASEPAFYLAAYCAAKAGLEMLCKVAADELGEHGVRVNVVRPGAIGIERPGHPLQDLDARAAYFDQQPLRQVGDPFDIAHAVRHLVGPESGWTTGAVLVVDGGNSLRRSPDLRWYWHDRIGEEIDKAARGDVD
jgi:NAD(P)-dependent dehydrogenase (short-subunit alcohol dehydrogenase family)